MFSHCRGPNPTSIKQWQINIISKINIKFHFGRICINGTKNIQMLNHHSSSKNIVITHVTLDKLCHIFQYEEIGHFRLEEFFYYPNIFAYFQKTRVEGSGI